MRITSKMMINNAKFWLSKQAERLNDAETVSASGKLINKPSDNPAEASAILKFRSDISRYEQYERNLTRASTLVEAEEEVFDSVDKLLAQALDIVTSLTSGKRDCIESYMTTVEEIYSSIMDLANTTYNGDYIYGGNLTDSSPFSNKMILTSGENTDSIYYLASDSPDVEVTIYDSNNQKVRTITTSGTGGSNSVTWDGLDDSSGVLEPGIYFFSVCAVDASGNTVAASCYQGDKGERLVSTGNGTTATINSNGGAIFTGALSALAQLIESFEAGNIESVLEETAAGLNGSVDTISYERVALSNIYTQINTSLDRVEKVSTILEEKLTKIENGSTAESAVELTSRKTAYEITTKAVAQILNMPKLSDYV